MCQIGVGVCADGREEILYASTRSHGGGHPVQKVVWTDLGGGGHPIKEFHMSWFGHPHAPTNNCLSFMQ